MTTARPLLPLSSRILLLGIGSLLLLAGLTFLVFEVPLPGLGITLAEVPQVLYLLVKQRLLLVLEALAEQYVVLAGSIGVLWCIHLVARPREEGYPKFSPGADIHCGVFTGFLWAAYPVQYDILAPYSRGFT